MKNAIIISTGNELVYGKVRDTNSAFLAAHLHSRGIEISEHITLPDDKGLLSESVARLLERADIIIISGGLGPTSDDITVEAVAEVFKLKVVLDEASSSKLVERFRLLGRETSGADMKMASIPETSVPLENPVGLAPGFVIKNKGKTVMALPGVPGEMEAMFLQSGLPQLAEEVSASPVESVFKIFGRKESEIDSFLAKVRNSISFDWGLTTELGTVTVTLSRCSQKEGEEIGSLLKKEFDISMLKGQNVTPVEEIIRLLQEKGLSIATAESCTGGLVGHLLTDIPGSSEVYHGSLTAYSNEVKTGILQVSPEILKAHGAVSLETAAAMAERAAKLFASDIAISTTGIAGPGGGTKEKPVGIVCFGFYLNGKTETAKKNFPGDRNSVRTRSALFALDYTRKFLRNL